AMQVLGGLPCCCRHRLGRLGVIAQESVDVIEAARPNLIIRRWRIPVATPHQFREAADEAVAFAKSHRAQPGEHVSLGWPLRIVIFLVLWAAGSGASVLLGLASGGVWGLGLMIAGGIFSFIFALWASHVVRVAAQWERGVILRLGRYHGLKGPGILLVFPVADRVRFVDTRLLTLEVPHQQVITRD